MCATSRYFNDVYLVEFDLGKDFIGDTIDSLDIHALDIVIYTYV